MGALDSLPRSMLGVAVAAAKYAPSSIVANGGGGDDGSPFVC